MLDYTTKTELIALYTLLNYGGSMWWNKQLRILSYGYPLSPIPQEAVEMKVKMNFNAEHINIKISENEKYFKEYLEEAHKRDFRVLVYFNVHAYEREFAKRHPDWIQKRDDDTMVDNLYGVRVAPCVNSPFREWAVDVIRRLASKYEIDGVFLDGPAYYPKACYCEYCREKFKEKHGYDLPKWEDWGNPIWNEFLEFRYDSIAEFLEVCKEALKEIKPNAVIYMNSNGLWPAWVNARDNRRLIVHQDILGAEGGFIFYTRPIDVPYWKPGATAKLLETQSNGKPTVIFIAGDHKPYSHYPLTDAEVRLLYADTIANGANPWFAPRKTQFELVTEINKFIEENAEYFENTKSIARVALVWSCRSADFYGASVPKIDFLPPGVKVGKASATRDFTEAFYGYYEALLRSHVPFDVVDDEFLEKGNINKYDVIVMPNVACLSKEAVDRLKEYVKRGGNIVATYETSLYNGWGKPLENFSLSDLFGVTFDRKLLGPFEWDYVVIKVRAGILSDQVLNNVPSPRFGIATRPLEGAKIVAVFREKSPGRYLPLQPESKYPAVTLKEYGKGKSVYLAGSFDASYWELRLKDFRLILTDPVIKLSRRVVELENAPSTLEVTVRKKINALIVHLVNFTGDMQRPIEWICPVHDVVVRIYDVKDVSKVKALKLKEDLEFTTHNGVVEVKVPRVFDHEVIVLE